MIYSFFFFNDTATTEIYTLSLHDALPIYRLGDILVKHQKIRSDQLDAAIHRQSKERDKKLGEILVGMGVISQEDLERYMRVQIEESVYYLFTWTQGTFNFESEVRPERQDFLVNINPESLLLEGARRVD